MMAEGRSHHTGREPRAGRAALHVIGAAPSEPAAPSPEQPDPDDLARRHNLSAQLTSFVGRERELTEVEQLLATTRLLTLTGPGGVGKTRLALELASGLVDAYDDGVWLAELATLTDPGLVPHVVATALGIPEQPGRPLPATLADALRHRQLLLVLDNCEHLVDACAPLVENLLRACPELRILATSREPLGVPGETTWPVPSLSIPPTDDGGPTTGGPSPVGPPSSVVDFEAVRLFVERAHAVLPSFAVTAENVAPVAEVCRRLDGIPLALELAAARVRVLSPRQIAARLDDRFRLLMGGSRTALPRHRTLGALVDWSYELLSEPERMLLRRLSVFAGGWTLEAAEAVAGDGRWEIPDAVLELLTGLVDKSLVLAEQHDGEARYRLLETIREFAAEKLRESGEETAIRDRHRDWSLAFAEAAELQLRTHQHEVGMAMLEAEHDNLRAAIAWSRTSPSDEAGPRLVGALAWFWNIHGYWGEARSHLEWALAAGGAQSPVVRAKLLTGLALFAFDRGDYAEAVERAEQAATLARAAGDGWGIRFALQILGLALQFQGQSARAVDVLEECLALARADGDTVNTAFALNWLGVVALTTREYPRARSLYEQCLKLWRELGSKNRIAAALILLGRIFQMQGEADRARALMEEGLALARAVSSPRSIGYALLYLGHLARERGEPERARSLYVGSLEQRAMAGDRRGIAQCLEALAGVAASAARGGPREQARRAAHLLGAAEHLREVTGSPLPPYERDVHDRDAEAARRALGDGGFAEAWAAGRAMTAEQATEHALEPTEAEPGSAAGSAPERHAGRPIAPQSLLSRREREVAALVARGLSNREIAQALVVGQRTVESHVTSILNKLGYTTRAQIVRWALEHGLAGEPS